MRQRQWREPHKWSLTLRQFSDVIEHCKVQPAYVETKKAKRFVSMYDINDLFVKSWTRGTGCGLAQLMTGPSEPRPAQLMLSHAWGEDAEECLAATKKHFDENGLDHDTPIWFCVFANYQAEDGAGPSIKQQLAMDPFGAVIKSIGVREGHGMLAVHTTKEDLYLRLWCMEISLGPPSL